jgi:hypothetical protein
MFIIDWIIRLWNRFYIYIEQQHHILQEQIRLRKECEEYEKRRRIEYETQRRQKFISEVQKHAFNLSLNDMYTKRDLVQFCNYTGIPMHISRSKPYMIDSIQRYFHSRRPVVNEPGSHECDICLQENIRLAAFTPCGHAFCQVCVSKLNECPTTCRRTLTLIVTFPTKRRKSQS